MTLDLSLPPALTPWIPGGLVPDPADCPPVRWGILGAGKIAAKFARDVRSTGASVALVGSRDAERAAAFAAEHGVPGSVGGYDALVSSDAVDGIYVATPHSEHHDCALLALAAGKPVLVEKAFARNRAEASAIIDAGRSRGLFVMEAMWSRFLPHYRVARELVSGGALGDIVQVVADHGQPISHVQRLRDPALAGGALLDLGVYPLSLIHLLLGTPDAVHAEGMLHESGVDATSASVLRYAGSQAIATTTMLARTQTTAWVAGSKGTIDFGPRFYGPGPLTITLGDAEPVTFDPAVEREGGFQFQIAEASRCIDAGLPESELNTHTDTLDVMAMMDEIRRQLGVTFPGELGSDAGAAR